jgi:hypothetical protein
MEKGDEQKEHNPDLSRINKEGGRKKCLKEKKINNPVT